MHLKGLLLIFAYRNSKDRNDSVDSSRYVPLKKAQLDQLLGEESYQRRGALSLRIS